MHCVASMSVFLMSDGQRAAKRVSVWVCVCVVTSVLIGMVPGVSTVECMSCGSVLANI